MVGGDRRLTDAAGGPEPARPAPPPLRLAGYAALADLLPPVALRVAATLRLSDHLAAGPRTVPELAEAAGADADALGRLLRYLVCLGVYRVAGRGAVALAPAGRMLVSGRPGGARDWLDLDAAGGRVDLALGGLLHAVRTGRPGYDAVFGRSFWADLAADPGLTASFDALMAGKSARLAEEIAEHLDWTGTDQVVDVGGGCGITLAAVLGRHPGLRGELVERPETAAAAGSHLHRAGLAGRCTVRAGSFFDPLPAGADRYLLVDILHDWDDAAAVRILRRCAEACPAGGAVVVVERQPADERDTAAADLKMLTLFAGRQRDVPGLGALGAAAALRAGPPVRLPSGFVALALHPRPVHRGRTADDRSGHPSTPFLAWVAGGGQAKEKRG